MVIFLNLDGTAQKVTPERIFQGSNNTIGITVIGKYPSSTALSIAFVLPTGITTQYYPMSYITTESGVGAWQYVLNDSITENAGNALISINATELKGNRTSYQVNFAIENSILPTLPTAPDDDVYDLIVLYLQQNAASITKLDIRVTALENTTIRKLLVDFTVNSITGEGIKYYTDGTTSTVQFPISDCCIPGLQTDWIHVIEFKAKDFNIDNELAFSAMQTGYFSDKYIALLDKAGETMYEVGLETEPEEHGGYWQTANTFFKGTDGSIYMQYNKPFDGRLVMFGGNTDNNAISNVSYSINGNKIVITYLDGTEVDVSLAELKQSLGTSTLNPISQNAVKIAIENLTKQFDNIIADVNHDISGKVSKSGDTMSGIIDMGGNNINNIKAAIVDNQAVNLKQLNEVKVTVNNHIADKNNPHAVTKAQVGLGNVDNTSDINKPISIDAQNALNTKAPIASPTFSGNVTLPSTTSIGPLSSTELGYLDGVTSPIQTQINAKASTVDITAELSKKADKATTLSGYGITNAYTKAEDNTMLALKSDTTYVNSELAKKANVSNAVTTDTAQTVSGVKTITGNIIANGVTLTPIELGYLDGVTSSVQSQLNNKSNRDNTPTLSGTNYFKSSNYFEDPIYILSTIYTGMTSLTPQELATLKGTTSRIQPQLNEKFDSSNVVQSLGSNETQVISQKVVSDNINSLFNEVNSLKGQNEWIGEIQTVAVGQEQTVLSQFVITKTGRQPRENDQVTIVDRSAIWAYASDNKWGLWLDVVLENATTATKGLVQIGGGISVSNGIISTNATNIGLGNLNNTSDMDKPVSNPQKSYIDNGLAGKANKAISLAGYNIADAYTKTEVNAALANKPDKTYVDTQLASKTDKTYVDAELSKKAPTVSPTFTGNAVLPITTTIGNISSTELGYLDGVTSPIQTQINAKASTVDITAELSKKADKATTLSGYGITNAYTKAEDNTMLALKSDTTYVNSELAKKANVSNAVTTDTAQTVSGVKTITGNIIANGVTLTPIELGYLDGVTSNVQPQIDKKQAITDNALPTTAKTVTGAIGELYASTVKNVAYNPSSNNLTVTFSNNATSMLQLSNAISDVSYNNTTNTLLFTYINGTTETVTLPQLNAKKYSRAYTSTDWSGSVQPYIISIPQTVHGKGTDPTIYTGSQVFGATIASNGDITLSSSVKKSFKITII